MLACVLSVLLNSDRLCYDLDLKCLPTGLVWWRLGLQLKAQLRGDWIRGCLNSSVDWSIDECIAKQAIRRWGLFEGTRSLGLGTCFWRVCVILCLSLSHTYTYTHAHHTPTYTPLSIFNSMVKALDFEARSPCSTKPYNLLAVWPWASYISLLYSNFLVCKMRILPPIS